MLFYHEHCGAFFTGLHIAWAQDKILSIFICFTFTSLRLSHFPPSQGKFSSFTLITELKICLIQQCGHLSVWLVLTCVHEETDTLLINIISILHSNKLVIPMEFEHIQKLETNERHLMFDIERDQTLINSNCY